MNSQAKDLFIKLCKVTAYVHKKFRRQGLAIPSKNADGSIKFGKFKVIKNNYGFFDIFDDDDMVVIKNINLAKSALVLANHLAVHHTINYKIVEQDNAYASASLEEQLYKKYSKRAKSIDKWDLMITKSMIAEARMKFHKQMIDCSFDKLQNLNK